jgi:RNA recognition motif-containing protein
MNMYIGNLSYNVRESDLRQVMEEYGTVESVKLIMDRNTNRSKGFAFVEMPEAAEAQQAINKLNGAEYVGRQMVVKEVGNYKAIVKLHKEVSVEIPFEVVAEEA